MKNLFILILSAMFLMNCTATVKQHSTKDKVLYDASYTYSDLQEITSKMAKRLVNNEPIKSKTNKPIIIVYNIDNRTSQHIDTKGLADSLRTKLFKTHKVKFINRTQRKNIEQELKYQYQSGNVDPNLRAEKAKQVGAEYILSGRIMSITKEQPKQFRFKKKKLKYYKLTLELTDIKTNIVEWMDEIEIVRESSQPLMGW